MLSAQLLIFLGVLAAAIVLDLILMRWIRQRWRVRSGDRQVRVAGVFSPVLTWIRYRRLPAAAEAAPVAAEEARASWSGTVSPGVTLIAGLLLIYAGQYELLAQGSLASPVSQWLNATLRLGLNNLDQVLSGLPLVLAGTLLVAVTLAKVRWLRAESDWASGQPDTLQLRWLRGFWPWLLAGGGLAALLLLRLSARLYGALSPWLWLVALALCAVAAWLWDRPSGVRHSPEIERQDWLWLLALVLAGLLIGSFRLTAVPTGLMGDEGAFFTTARDIASGQYRPPLFDFGVYTYPILGSIFQAGVLRLFGASLWAWRFASVLAALVAVVPLYLLARDWFNRRVAVAAGLSLVSLPYFLAFARLGYNNSQTLAPLTLAAYWLFLGLSRGSALFLYLAGCAAGLGFYTYTAGRSALVIVSLFLFLVWLTRPARLPHLLKVLALVGLGWFLVAAPHLAFGGAVNPASHGRKLFESVFFSADFGRLYFSDADLYAVMGPIRAGETGLFFNPRLYAILLLRGLVRTLLAFQSPNLVTEHFIASPLAGVHGVPFYLAGLGLTMACWRQRRFQYLAIWFWATVFFLSAANTYPPRHQHMVGVLPALALLIGLALAASVETLAGLLGQHRQAWRAALLCLGLAGLVVSGLEQYFVVMPWRYRPNLEQVVSSAALNARGRRLVFVYDERLANSSLANRGPFAVAEILRDPALYTPVAVEDLGAALDDLPLADPMLVFFPPGAAQAVTAALVRVWPQAFSQTFYSYEGAEIGGLVSNAPLDFWPSTAASTILRDSYGPLMPILAVLLLVFVGLIVFPVYWPGLLGHRQAG